MASPRATYLAAIETCLKRIKAVDGYNTDAGAYVTREPEPKVDTDAAFVTVVWSRQERSPSPGMARQMRLTTVSIIAKVPAGGDVAQDRLDAIVTDLEQALDRKYSDFPAGYVFPQYQSAEPITPPAGAGWIGVVITAAGHIPVRNP